MIVSSSSREQLSSKQCEDLGFTGLALCSDCNTFYEYVKEKGIIIQPFYQILSFNFGFQCYTVLAVLFD